MGGLGISQAREAVRLLFVTAALARVRTWRFKGDWALIGEPSRQELLRRLECLL